MRRDRGAALLAAVVFCAGAVVGCNRAMARMPGAAGSFHPARTGYAAKSTVQRRVRVALPTDARSDHYGQRVAGTRWKACRTDPVWSDVPTLVSGELERELRDSRVFTEVVADSQPSELVLDTEIRAFCAQAWGFVYIRIAGVVALHVTLRDGDRVLFERTIEDVVTDADERYTGPQVDTIERAMKIALSDSLRAVLHELLWRLDEVQPPATAPAATPAR
jgi:hypothetical protein